MSITNDELTREEFIQIMDGSIRLGKCTCGYGGGEVRIMLPWYGKTGLFITCPQCSRSTKLFGVFETIFSEDKSLGTPTTYNAVTQALRLAVDCWNNNEVDFYNNHRRKT